MLKLSTFYEMLFHRASSNNNRFFSGHFLSFCSFMLKSSPGAFKDHKEDKEATMLIDKMHIALKTCCPFPPSLS